MTGAGLQYTSVPLTATTAIAAMASATHGVGVLTAEPDGTTAILAIPVTTDTTVMDMVITTDTGTAIMMDFLPDTIITTSIATDHLPTVTSPATVSTMARQKTAI